MIKNEYSKKKEKIIIVIIIYKVYPSFINNIIVILIWKIFLLELVK